MQITNLMSLQPWQYWEKLLSARKEIKIGVGVVVGSGFLIKLVRYVVYVLRLRQARIHKKRDRDNDLKTLATRLETHGKVSAPAMK